MFFFSGRLGAIERMMTEKPGYHRRSGKSGRDIPQKKPTPEKAAPKQTKEVKDDKNDG